MYTEATLYNSITPPFNNPTASVRSVEITSSFNNQPYNQIDRNIGKVGSFIFFNGRPEWNGNIGDGGTTRYGFPENELQYVTNVSQLIYPMYDDTIINNCFIFIEMNNIVEIDVTNIGVSL